MSAKHPTPWSTSICRIKFGKNTLQEWGSVIDDNGFHLAQTADITTADEIAEAVNERAALRGLVRRLADNLRRYHINGERDNALLKEAREALEGAE